LTNQSKIAARGIQKRNQNLLKFKLFEDVLFDRLPGSLPRVENVGFRNRQIPGGGGEKSIHTYSMNRVGLNATYLKRGIFSSLTETFTLPI